MESISSAPKQSVETTIHTGGGAYISGNVVADTFIGRDQYNYYFIGLAPLVHDPTRRFRNFLNEYLGTPSQPVPFGGRQAQLAELHSWLNDAGAPPYYLMTAEAGRGKSALVCRWMEEVRQQRPAVEVIFIPISIRFETAAQDTVFAALAARLAQFYDEPLKPAALSGAQWQGVCESYLDRTPPNGKQLLIILDGLDEATGWQFGAGFFSTDPPPGLRVVVTARLRVGESTPQGWAATLGWQERLTRIMTLPPLTPLGVEEALISMGDPLARLADQAAIIEQLYRLTEGDPLLVRLYVQEFEKQKATTGTLTSTALQQMMPGLQGYFDQWWKGQKAQWRAQGSDPEKEEVHLHLLLDAFSAAFGPLTLDDLAHLHPELGSSRLIRAQLQSVERWVIGDGKTQGYTYSHSRLGYYFWEKLSGKEQREWDERFCAWGARTLAALNGGELDPKAAPVYLLRHYGEHLERSRAPAEAFYALISNGWRLAWEWLDVSYSGFLGDVDRVWEQARQAFTLNQGGRTEALVQQVHVALCWSSIATFGNNMPPNLLVQLVELKFYTVVQALTAIKRIPREQQRVRGVIGLANYLSVDLASEISTIVHTIKDLNLRAYLVKMLKQHLPENQQSEILSEPLIDTEIIIQQPPYSSSSFAPNLPEDIPINVLVEALNIAKRKASRDRAVELSSLAPRLPKYLLDEVLEAVGEIDRETYRAIAISNLSPYLSNHLFEKALTICDSIWEEGWRPHALNGVVPHLPEHLLETALVIARKTSNHYERADILSEIASRLPKSKRIKVLKEALTTVHMIGDDSDQHFALWHFDAQTVANGRFTTVKEKWIPIDFWLKHELSSHRTKHEMLSEALTTVISFNEFISRTAELGNLAPHLAEWATQQPSSAYTNFVSALPILATYPLGDFLGDLSRLRPFILALAGDEAPQAAEGIYHAIQEVCGWWP